MITYILVAVQLILLVAIAVLFLQIRHYLHKIPDDEVLGDNRANYITKRLNGITACICTVSILMMLEIILRFT